MIVPFAGDAEEAPGTLESLTRLRLSDGDELIVADNSPDQVFPRDPGRGVRVVEASGQRSSYYARNVAAESATGEWLLFLDADCSPTKDLLDAYFEVETGDAVGLMGGPVLTEGSGSGSLLGRWGHSRERQRERFHLEVHPLPAAPTANLLVNRSAWEQVGGFQEGIRSAGDIEFCWRVQEAGWEFAYAAEASVAHAPVERIGTFLRRSARHGAGRSWLNRRYRGWWPAPGLARGIVRGIGGALAYAVTFRGEQAAFKAVDLAAVISNGIGALKGNGAVEPGGPELRNDGGGAKGPGILIVTDWFPALSETFVSNEARILLGLGRQVRVEANTRPPRPDRAAARELGPSYLEDDGVAAKLFALAGLAARHPLGCLRDLAGRRRWSREEEVWPLRSLAPQAKRIRAHGERLIHVHFAGPAALSAMRLARLLGLRWTLTAHAYDIYQLPRNLAEKVRSADFTTSQPPGLYDLADIPDYDADRRLHRIVYGIDPEKFRRCTTYDAEGRVLAVGRLVEKKGFATLIEAAARLKHAAGPLRKVTIIGDGPLREELDGRVAELGVGDVVELIGWTEPHEVQKHLESTSVLAMPCVVAADGDRDSMPMVVKEAMAMEVPVVASDEVGLPEIVRSDWGRLVPPGDPDALAEAISELLSMPAAERAAMGKAARKFAVEHTNVHTETVKLAAHFDEVLEARSQRR